MFGKNKAGLAFKTEKNSRELKLKDLLRTAITRQFKMVAGELQSWS